jgi:hypothetical protein
MSSALYNLVEAEVAVEMQHKWSPMYNLVEVGVEELYNSVEAGVAVEL